MESTLPQLVEIVRTLYQGRKLMLEQSAEDVAAAIEDGRTIDQAEVLFRSTVVRMTPAKDEHIRSFFERVRTRVQSRAA